MKTLSERIADACATHDIYNVLGLDPRKRVFLCPLPQHIHKAYTPSFSVFSHKGRQYFRCHGNCGLEGDVVDLVGYLRVPGYDGKDIQKINDALGLIDERYAIEIPVIHEDVRLAGTEWKDFLPPGDEVIAYAARRGLTVETLEKFRVGQFGHFMAIPTFEEGVLKGVKMRNILDCPPNKRFWNLTGSRLGLFNYDAVNMVETSERNPRVTWIVKGEIPAMLMDQMGFHRVCAPSQGEGSGTIKIIREWGTALALAAKIVIGDNDAPGATLGWKRSEMFGATLRYPPSIFKDLDEWLLASGHNAITILKMWEKETVDSWL